MRQPCVRSEFAASQRFADFTPYYGPMLDCSRPHALDTRLVENPCSNFKGVPAKRRACEFRAGVHTWRYARTACACSNFKTDFRARRTRKPKNGTLSAMVTNTSSFKILNISAARARSILVAKDGQVMSSNPGGKCTTCLKPGHA